MNSSQGKTTCDFNPFPHQWQPSHSNCNLYTHEGEVLIEKDESQYHYVV